MHMYVFSFSNSSLATTATSYSSIFTTKFPAIRTTFQATHTSINPRRVLQFARMASGAGLQFPQAHTDEYKRANKLHGKVALVTGGDSGIGRAVCNCFALEGATVAFTYVKGQEDKDAQDTLQRIKKAKSSDAKDPIAIPADLGFDENCKRVVDEVVNAFGVFS